MTYFRMGKPHTIIGAEQFHFRVRDGVGWDLFAMAARRKKCWLREVHHALKACRTAWVLYGQASRVISTGQLHTLPCVHIPPIHLVVYKGPSGTSRVQGGLILGGASRLDAFSGYPVRT